MFPVFFHCSAAPLDLHSFPTRRSSDLALAVLLLCAAIAFVAGTPYAVLDSPTFLAAVTGIGRHLGAGQDRKSTRLNSSDRCISYAVFCLNKKKNDGFNSPLPI